MKTAKNNNQIGQISQFQSIVEIVSMMKSLTRFMNTTAPSNLSNDFSFALADINYLVINLESMVEKIASKIDSGSGKLQCIKNNSQRDDASNLVITPDGVLLYINTLYLK